MLFVNDTERVSYAGTEYGTGYHDQVPIGQCAACVLWKIAAAAKSASPLVCSCVWCSACCLVWFAGGGLLIA